MLKIYCYPLQQLSFLIGVLTEYGKPVILVGENGCGKTSIINDRIQTKIKRLILYTKIRLILQNQNGMSPVSETVVA
jgi:ABC-type cobalamin/Fe3+-siderophores transport system ATPase subunit